QAKLVKQEQAAINAKYLRVQRPGRRCTYLVSFSTLMNKSRLKLLHRCEGHIQGVSHITRNEIVKLAKDKSRFVQFLEGVILQDLLQLLELSTTVFV
ncbi:hypothetical protein K488DRAFT_58118, partial [Vararia minispora EC-137]